MVSGGDTYKSFGNEDERKDQRALREEKGRKEINVRMRCLGQCDERKQ